MRNYNELTDEQLISSYADGNNVAFDTLLLRHKDRLYSYIYQIVHDNDVADDIFQETFVKVITTVRQGRYQDMGKFSAWVTRIARNLAIDSFRAEKNEATVSTDNSDMDILNRKELCVDTIEDMMIDIQTEEDIRTLVERLPDEQREVLMMRYYQELSFKEIAELTGVSINTALGRMRYAILNLRKMAKQRELIPSR